MQSWWMLLGALPVTENQGFFKYKLFHVLVNNSAGSPAKEPNIELCYRKKDSSYINFVTTDRPHGVTLLTYWGQVSGLTTVHPGDRSRKYHLHEFLNHPHILPLRIYQEQKWFKKEIR